MLRWKKKLHDHDGADADEANSLVARTGQRAEPHIQITQASDGTVFSSPTPALPRFGSFRAPLMTRPINSLTPPLYSCHIDTNNKGEAQ